MRLSNREKELIKKAFGEVFEEGKIYLFGSIDVVMAKDKKRLIEQVAIRDGVEL